MKVTAILKGRPDKDGKRTVYIRINEGKKRTFKATKIRVIKTDFAGGRVINHPNAKMYNTTIKKLIVETEHSLIDQPTGKYSEVDFFVFANKWIDTLEKTGERSPGTIKGYRSQINNLEGYRPAVNLSGIDKTFLDGYKLHRIKEDKVSGNTLWNSFKFIHTIIKVALADDLLQKDPFLKFQMPRYKDPQKQYLSRAQLTQIEKAKLSPELRKVATWFLICCYTGFRFGDANTFDKKKNIRSGRLVLVTGKTGDVVSLPVSEKVRGYFESLNYRPMGMSNQYINRALKTIAEAAGIDMNLTYHVSRHTFAVMAAEAGISQEVVARLMGHRSLKSTGVYYRITNPRIDAEIGRLG